MKFEQRFKVLIAQVGPDLFVIGPTADQYADNQFHPQQLQNKAYSYESKVTIPDRQPVKTELYQVIHILSVFGSILSLKL